MIFKARVGCSERIALKQVYYQGWNRPPTQVGCMRQVLRAGALRKPRGMGWGERREWRSGWGTHVNPWLIHVNVWQKSLQYYKVISLQLIKINEKKRKKRKGRGTRDQKKKKKKVNTDFKYIEKEKERTFRQKRKFSNIIRPRGAWGTEKFQKDQMALFLEL